MSDVKPKVVVIVGPTGSGKTDLAIAIAEEFGGEVIAADSRTVYRGMDIGTAKPIASEGNAASLPTRSSRGPAGPEGPHAPRNDVLVVRGIPHHLMDIRYPDESYTVAEFQRDAEGLIREMVGRGKVPVVVGGTGLYVQALVENLTIPSVVANPKLRESFGTKSNNALLELLRDLDPATADRIDPKNTRRIIRALEVSILSGQPFYTLRQKSEPLFDAFEIGILLSREELYRRIDQRTAQWLAGGLIREACELMARYGPSCEPLRGVIYRQTIEAIQRNPHLGFPGTEADLQRLESSINGALHAYARQQASWFRRDQQIHWVTTPEEATTLVRGWVLDHS